ncbi:metallophosphoesterase family protein [Peribacillus sp. SCS-155]|uniref:metallophosphoesterase family protein n=1 Tax=Peribacillus sedimenti TaxID=3115297 RepID=UPI00390651B1
MKRLIIMVLIILCPLIQEHSAKAEKYNHVSKPILQIPVLSDVHICGNPRRIEEKLICLTERDDHFIRVLEDLQTVAPDYKAIAIVGDLTDQGLEIQYDKFMDLLFWAGNPRAERLLAIGNHEFFERKMWYKPALTEDDLMKRFQQKTYMGGIFYNKWIKGYHFIVLGSEGLNTSHPGSANLSEAQFSWLERTLKENTDDDKPIFVFLHQPIRNTVFGSQSREPDPVGKRLRNILRKYPQAILFSGHSHYQLKHPKNIYRDIFTMVNTGAIYYIVDEKGKNLEDSQGLVVNVYKDHVDIMARDFSYRNWINKFTIPLTKSNQK